MNSNSIFAAALSLAFAVAAPSLDAQYVSFSNLTYTYVKKDPEWNRHFGGNSNDWKEISADLRASAYGSLYTANINRSSPKIRKAYSRALASAVATVCGRTGTAGKIYLNAKARNGNFAGSSGRVHSYYYGNATSGRFYFYTFGRYMFDSTVTRSATFRKNWDLTAFSKKVPFSIGPVPMSISAKLGVRIATNAWSLQYASNSYVNAGVGGSGSVAPYADMRCGIDAWLASAGVGGKAVLGKLETSLDLRTNNYGPAGKIGASVTPFSVTAYIWAKLSGIATKKWNLARWSSSSIPLFNIHL